MIAFVTKAFISVDWNGKNIKELKAICKFNDFQITEELQLTFLSKEGMANEQLLIVNLGDYVVFFPFENKYLVYNINDFNDEFAINFFIQKINSEDSEDKFLLDTANHYIRD